MDFEQEKNIQTEALPTDGEAVVEEPVIEDIPGSEPKVVKKKLPLVCKIIYALAGLCAILYVAFLFSVPLCDFFNRTVSPVIRIVLAKLTGWIPFSLAEFLLLLSPLIVAVVVYMGIKHFSASWRNVLVFCLAILSVAAYVFSAFTLAFVPAYRGSTLDVKMGLDKQKVSAEELYYTSQIVTDKLKQLNGEIAFREDTDFSVMPYSYAELNDKLMQAYDAASEKYDFIQPFNSRVKRIMLSEPMTYTHISGVYTFFTGEANVNTNFPDYTLPFTAAHELAHQRGIAREDEANFVAFLVCSSSDDAYIQYSAYLNMYEYLVSALSRANSQYYSLIYVQLPQNVKLELKAYSKFFDKYRENVANKVSETVNDNFIKSNGVKEGTQSYGMVVDLAVAYYKSEN